MNQKESGKRSANFLQRFQGKRSTITKEGLNYLFDQHQNKLLHNISPKSVDQKKINADASNKSLIKISKNQIVRSGSEIRADIIDNKTSRLSRRTQILRRQSEEINKPDEFTLPRIINRFSNSLNKLNHNKKVIQQVRHHHLNSEIIHPRKSGYLMSKNLDENAMQHLQFLSKLQQKLAGMRSKNDKH